ncbi:Uncharacterised protein [Mycobacteroides abscessus subsp. abscessus]|nr:Uncharacterised protein [Mycobacteroides abscessus subsp. abscessus]
MLNLAVPGGDPIQVRAVADEVGGPRQLLAHLGGGPIVMPRAQAEDRDHPVRVGVGGRLCSGDQDQREVRHRGGVHLGGGKYPLARGTGPFHVVRAIQQAGGVQRLAHGAVGPAQFHDDRGMGIAEPAGDLVGGQGAGNHGQNLVPLHQWGAGGGRGGAERCHAGDDDGVESVGQTAMHMHIRAVEQRIALGQQCHAPSGIEMCGNPVRGLFVEVVDRAAVAAGVIGGFGGDRVDQMLFDLAWSQIWLGDRTGDAATMPCAVKCHHIGIADHPCGLDRHQLGITGAESHAPQHPAGFVRIGHAPLVLIARNRIHRSGRHRAAAAPPLHQQILHAPRAVDQFLF